MLRALKPEKRPYRAWLAGHPDRKAIFDRLEWKAFSTLLWGLDALDPKAIRLYREVFRRLPDGTARLRPGNGGMRWAADGWRSEPRGHGPEVPGGQEPEVRPQAGSGSCPPTRAAVRVPG